MRTIPSVVLQEMLAQHSQSVMLSLLKIDHASFPDGPIFLVNDKVGLVRGNLLLRSEEFDNAVWTKDTGVVVTANQSTAPDGSSGMDQIDLTSAANFTGVGQPVASVPAVSGASRIASVYLKAGTLTNVLVSIQYFNGTFQNADANVNLANGTVTGVGATIKSVGGGVYRVSISLAHNDTNTSTSVKIRRNTTGGTVFAWGAQLVEGSAVPAYIPTTTTAAAILTYEALPFNLDLPNDLDGDELPVLQLTIDNVSRKLVAPLRTVTTPPTVQAEIISLLAYGELVTDIGPLDFVLQDIEMDVHRITVSLAYEADYLNMAATKGHFDPASAPALFS